MNFGAINYLTIVIYMGMMVAMGFWFSRREKTSEEYLLGGRKMPWWAVGISYKISIISTISLVMIPGEIYNHGLSLFLAQIFLPITSLIGFFLCVRFYFKLKVFTPFEYLERRYDSSVRIVISMLYFWTRLAYLSMVLYASSKIFESAVGWPVMITIPVIAMIGIFYTFLGGMRVVIWTDVIQFFVLFGGMLLIIVMICKNVDGGFIGVLNYSLEHDRGPIHYANPDFYRLDPYLRLCFWFILINELVNPIYIACADQITIQRLLSAGTYEKAKYAAYTNSVLLVPMVLMLWLIGFSIFTYYGLYPDPSVTTGDAALYTFIATKMPAPLPGLILAAMLAAAMSTLDSGINSLSAVMLKDVYLKYINPSATEGRQYAIARILTVAIGVIAIAVALSIAGTASKLRETVVEAGAIWNSYGIVLGPVFLITVCSRKVNSRVIWVGLTFSWGVITGMITWYVSSKNGLEGAIPIKTILIPLAVAGFLFLVAALLKISRKSHVFSAGLLAVFALAYSFSTSFWYYSGRYTEGGVLSFQWVQFPGIFIFLFVGFGLLLFCRKPEKKKHFGLTLWSTGETPIEDS